MVSKFFDRPFDRTFDFLWPPGHAKKKTTAPSTFSVGFYRRFLKTVFGMGRNRRVPSGHWILCRIPAPFASFRHVCWIFSNEKAREPCRFGFFGPKHWIYPT